MPRALQVAEVKPEILAPEAGWQPEARPAREAAA